MPTDTVNIVRLRPIMAQIIADVIPRGVDVRTLNSAERDMYAALCARRHRELARHTPYQTRASLRHMGLMPDLVGVSLPLPYVFHVPVSNDMDGVD